MFIYVDQHAVAASVRLMLRQMGLYDYRVTEDVVAVVIGSYYTLSYAVKSGDPYEIWQGDGSWDRLRKVYKTLDRKNDERRWNSGIVQTVIRTQKELSSDHRRTD